MRRGSFVLPILTLVFAFGSLSPAADAVQRPRKIVLLAGKQLSHPPGCHEYEKDMAVLKQCLDTAEDVQGVKTHLCLGGWPADPSVLEDADSIALVSDGCDRNELAHPFLEGDRLAVIEKQMRRGCGLWIMHYSTFVPSSKAGSQFLEWVGGFFDYQGGPNGAWYSAIKAATVTVSPATFGHPICRGLKPFPLQEEYYYRMRFRPNDPRLAPILLAPIPGEAQPQVVAWAVQRADGGRGFTFTGGHSPENLKLDILRKMLLNSLLWTAKVDVPAGGVRSTLPASAAAGTPKQEKPIKALILTGHHHPGHPWQASTQALQEVLWQDPRFLIDVAVDPQYLADARLADYDLIVQNYCNWERPGPSAAAKAALQQYVVQGGGLAIIHFANGAFGPGAHPPAPDDLWPEYCGKLCRRTWIDGQSGHDAFGPFRVQMTDRKHPITEGMVPFDTVDELYFSQQGSEPIEPLAVAHSKVTGKDEPMAFAYDYGKGRVYQTLLGHDAKSITGAGPAELIRRGCVWAAGREQRPVSTKPGASRRGDERFRAALDATKMIGSVQESEVYSRTPLTVECWVKINGKAGFNVFVANEPKSSGTHWELYSFAGTGGLSLFMPGYDPQGFDSGKDLADGQWHYVAMTFDGTTAQLFVDAERVGSAQLKRRADMPSRSGPLTLGRAYDENHQVPCDGLIDEVRISKTIRNIQRVPEGPLAADADTLGLWHFDDDVRRLRFGDASSRNCPADVELRLE